MNKTYRLIWNRRLGAWVAAAETTRASGKKASGRARTGLAAAGFAVALGASLPLAAADLAPGALPTGGTVAAGQAAIAASGTRMDITQSSQKAIINWQGFDIGSQAQVNFAQPNASAVALNRVSGPNISRIEGQLTANGQVFLVNPSGVIFGNGARVNAGAFVASTLNIRDDDFLAGTYTFTGTGGAIENRGTISAAPGGYVAFIAPKITNAGTVSAPQGTVAMGAGERVTLNFAGDRLVGLSVAAETLDTLIENRQAIRAEGGAILLTAAGAEAVTRGVINNSGVLEASSLTADGGRIVLAAGNDINLASTSTVAVDGQKGGEITIQAKAGTLLADGILSARGASGTGGSVRLLGQQVGLVNAAQVDASGAMGGGSVLVGGDYQGGNAAVQNAFRTYVGPQATIKADALQQGDGGKVIVWADDATRFAGTVSARGGTAGGDGGLVEVSGKGALDFQGQVDTRAPLGKTGSLLLDPTDITISGAASTPTVVSGGNFSDPATTPSNLNVNTLVTQLGLSNVTVSTASGLGGQGDITVNNAINYNSANSLTLAANRSITVVAGSGGINNAGAGAVTLTGAGAGVIAVNENITTNGGTIALTSGTGGVTLAAAKAIDAGSGTIAINSGGGAANFSSGTLRTSNATAAAIGVSNATTLTLGNVALSGGGTLSVSHSGAGTQTGGTSISGTGGLTKAGTGTLTLSQANSYAGATVVNGGTLSLGASNVLGDATAVTVNAGATLAVNNRVDRVGSLQGAGAVTSAAGGQLIVGGNGGSTTFSGVMSGAGGLVKEGNGTLTLTGANTYTGATGVSGGTLALSGATGAATGTAFTINQGSRLLLDNAAANNNNRIAGAVTMNGGELAITGNAAANTTETIGALTFNSGYSTVTLTPDAARNTQVTFASLARTNNSGAAALFRGTNLGANTIASQTAGSSNIVFTTAPALAGTGNSGTATVGIVAWAIGAGGASGATSTGTDFVTYNPPTGSVNGLRPLLASEYAAAPAANVNLKLTANRTADDTFTINSLLLAGGVTYNFDNAAGANTLTVASGNVLSLGAGNTLQPAQNTGTLAFGTAQPNIFTIGDLTLGSNLAVTGTRVLGKSGAGTLQENRAVARTGGIVVNSGTLRSGVANAFASQAVTVRAGGLFDLNGFANTVSSLTLESGATAGAAVTTGAGTLTLAGNLGLNVNGTGTTGATISGNLTETATRTYTVNDGVAADDLTIAAVISGAGGVTKAGNGTLALAGANTYTGVTTISAGTLSANTLANGGVASSIGASTNAATNLVFGGGTLQYTGGTASTNRNYTLNAGTTDTIRVTNAATNLTISGASTATTGALTKTGAGTLTLSGANLNTGTTTVAGGTLALGANNVLSGAVTVTGGAAFDIGAFSDAVGTVTLTDGNITGTTGTLTGTSYAVQNGTISAILGGAAGLTKTTAGTVTLSVANTYTGATTINGGVLSVSSLANGGSASNIGASSSAAANLVINNGTLRYTGATASTDRNVTLTAGATGSIDVTGAATNLTISGATTNTTGRLTKLGDGTLTLTGTNLNSGTTTIAAGTLQVGNGGTTGSLGAGGVTNLGRLVFNRSDAITVSNVVSSFGELVKDGSGTTTLTGANTYTGATTINAGTLALGTANERISNASAVTVAAGATFNLGGFSETIGSLAGAGTVINNGGAAATLTTGGNNTSTTFSGSLQNGTAALALTKTGTGTLTLSGNNTYTGATTINTGVLQANGGSAIGDSSAVTVAGGATLALGAGETIGSLAGAGNVTLGSAILTAGGNGTNTTFSGVMSGTGGLTKTGASQLTLSGANTYTGATTISSGTLALSGGAAIWDTSAVNLSAAGANLTLNASETIGSLAGVASTSVALNGNTLSTGGNNNTTTYAGNIGGTGNLDKNGTGSMTLSGNNTYAGLTTVNAGTLAVTANNALGSNAAGTTVNAGATLDLQNVAYSTAELVTLNGGTLAVSTGNSSLAGPVNLTAASVVNVGGPSQLTLSGAVTAPVNLDVSGGGSLTAVNATNDFSTVSITSGNNISLRDANAIDLGASTVSGALTVTSSGNISQSGSLNVAGLTTLAAGGGDITLNNGSNNFGTVAASAVNVALADSNAIDLGTTNAAANLTVSANGAITQSGVLTVAGASTFLANANPIVLNNASNDFGGEVALSNSGSANNVQIRDVNDLTLGASSIGGTLTAIAGGTLTLSSVGTGVSAGGSGDAITLVGSRFVNLFGAGALSAPAGRWLVWSSNPSPFSGATPDNRGGLAYDFKQYNATTYGVTPVQGTGNGFLYTLAPSITPGLTSPPQVSKDYDGNTTATLAPGNFTASGAVDGDTVTLGATSATYDNKNVGTNKLVTATGISMTSATNGSASVYGYSVNPTTASANIGAINPAALTVSSIAAVSTTYGTPAATGAVSLNGVISGDTVTSTASIVSPTYSTSGNLNAGSYAQSASSLGGADAGNYTLTAYTTPTNNYSVGQLALTGASIAASGSTYGSPLNPGAVSFGNVISGDIVTSTAGVNTSTVSSSGNPIVGSYTQTASVIGGADAANYSFAGYTSGSNYTINPLTLTSAAIGASSSTYGSPLNPGAVSFSNVIAGDNVTSTAGVNTSTLSSSGNPIVGSYTQTAGALAGTDAANYSFAGYTTPTANYAVTQLALVGGITVANKVYDATTEATIASRSLSGVVSGDQVAYIGGSASFVDPNAGYGKAVTANGLALAGADAGNYTVNSVATTTTDITPAPLTITANDASRPVNTPNPPFSATYSGFVGGETPAVLNGALSFSTPATPASPVGIYPISPYGQSSGNYAITYVDGNLTVSGVPVINPTLPREAVNQQAIAAQYTDPTMSTESLVGPYYVFDDDRDGKDGMPPASAVRIVGSGIRLPN